MNDIFSVSSYLDKLNSTLKTERAKINGEISGLQMYEGRSYLYFSLKDSKDGSTIKCFMWKNDYKISGVDLRDGLEVVITAYPNIYKPNGGLTLQVELVELIGEGALKIAYEELKRKLETEGLFSDSKKREIPVYPHRIGVITSKSGAVINDFLTNIGKFGFEIIFVDSKVEGQDAIKDLLASVKTLETKDIDVLVMMRGGGSLESFLAFNNETLVRAIADFPVPVITGIGHDKDVPLVSLVSDKNVSTPTAVAHILNESWELATSGIKLSEEKILSAFQSSLRDTQFTIENSNISIERSFLNLFDTFRKAEVTVINAVSKIESQISRLSDTLERDVKEIMNGFGNLLSRLNDILLQTEKSLESSNPEKQLKRGYSIIRFGKKVIRSTKEVSPGDKLDIMLSDGNIDTQVI